MGKRFLLVDSDVLPDIYLKVILAKEMIASGAVKNLSLAAKEVGISRSAFYKYKDKVFDVSETKTIVAIHVVLVDELGALQNLLKIIAKLNISIVTITQSAPVDGTAAVSITMRVKDMIGDVDNLIDEISKQSFVVSAKRILQDM